MKFCINGQNWEIIKKPNDEIQEMYIKATGIKDGYCYGLTCYSQQKIYINIGINPECKITTLKHELTHCYLWSYGFRMVNYDEEIVCDIVANSNDFINEIINKYREEVLDMACGGKKKKGGRRK